MYHGRIKSCDEAEPPRSETNAGYLQLAVLSGCSWKSVQPSTMHGDLPSLRRALTKMAWFDRMGLLKAKREVVVNIGCPLAVVHSNLVIVVVASSLHAERPDISYAQAGP